MGNVHRNNPNLLRKPIGHREILGPSLGNMLRDFIIIGDLDFGSIHHHEIPPLRNSVLSLLPFERLTYRQTQLVPHLIQCLHPFLISFDGLLVISMRLSILKRNRDGFLKRRDTAEHNSGVCGSGILDQMRFTNQPSYSPSRATKCFPCGSHGDSTT